MPRRLDAVDAAVRESARRARGPRRFRDGVHSTQEDDVGDVAAELPRPPPDSDDEDEGVELRLRHMVDAIVSQEVGELS